MNAESSKNVKIFNIIEKSLSFYEFYEIFSEFGYSTKFEY